MKELALHLMDIAENSVGGGATKITILVEENTEEDYLQIAVEDNGRGMDAEFLANVVNPFTTTRTTRKVGLGIPLFKEACESCNGTFKIESEVGKGTKVEATFQHSHIDRMPLGDIAHTILCLVVAYPNIHWNFKYIYNQNVFDFDDQPIKDELEGISFSEPDILTFLREYITGGIESVQYKQEKVINPGE